MKYIFVFLSMLMFSCSDEPDKMLVSGEDGLLYQQGSSTPFTGIEKGFVDNKYIEYEVVNGERHGYFRIMDSAKRLETSGHISHNKYEGEWKYYYKDGKVESQGLFKDDMPSGEWKWFYPNGSLKEAGKYLEGRREGEWKYYFANGQLQRVRVFKEGQIIEDNETENTNL